MSRVPAPYQPRLPFQSAFGSTNQFGNFGLSNQLNGMNGMVLGVTPRILDRQYRQDLTGALGDLNGAFGFGGSGSGARGGGGSTDGYKELSDSLMGQIGQQGAARTDQINRAFDASLDSQLSRLYDRGFGNSSMATSTQLESDRNRESALTELMDSLLSQKIGVGQTVGLAGLNQEQMNQRAQQQFKYQLYGGLLGGLFG